MDNTTYSSRLQYLDADAVDDSVVDFDGLDVKGPDGQKIGDVDGFIVDTEAGRVYYVVVDSGGWFASRSFLLPVGHARLEADAHALKVDVTKPTLSNYPEFDKDRFRELSDEDLRTFESRMAAACCPDEAIEDVAVGTWAYDRRRHYAQPDWWRRDAARERVRPVHTPATPGRTVPTKDEYNAERVTARERDRETVAPGGEASPHAGGRAQPGDVLGIETGGERTYVGDTDEDENKRRRDAERAAAKTDRE